MNNSENYDADVLVVGTGPMGATAALALATYGVRVQVISKWSWLSTTPRAHITNQRAVEVLRDLGIEKEVTLYATPWDKMGDTLFTTSLAGPEIARLRTWGTGDERYGDYLAGSPCPMLDVPQTYMEPVLVTNAASRGAIVSFNTEYLSHVQDDEGVTATLKNRLTGTTYTQRFRYLVGADGAKSQIADEIGLPIEGELARAGTVYVQFKADLSTYVAHRPSILYWIMNPTASFGEIGMGLLRAVRPWHQWIGGWGFDMSKGDPDTSPETALRNIRALVGDPTLEIEIESISPWYVNRAQATTYSKGRVFCGGDAVHRHPPSSGLGSNTSIQDAYNLAWKLAFVIKGYADPDLLDSYSLERAPVGAQVVARANQSRVDYGPLNAAFAAPGADDLLAAGLAKINAPTAEGAKVRAELLEALDLKNYEFNAQGTESNQRYESGAVIEDPEEAPEVWRRDKALYLQQTSRPGAKIPHTWLVDGDGHRVSTLDVTCGGQLSIVTGLSGQAWVTAAEELGLPFLRTVVVGGEVVKDPYGNWAHIREIEEGGVLLIRPDGYVAWRHRAAVYKPEDARRLLNGALTRLLGASVVENVHA